MNRLQRRHSSRRKNLQNACADIAKLTDSQNLSLIQMLEKLLPDMDHLIVDDQHKIIYCLVPKVASTNWKRVLLALNTDSKQGSNELNPLRFRGNESSVLNSFKTLNQYSDMEEVLFKINNYLKFVFVRHPFERLLSAYRNKFENAYSDYFRERFGRKIVKFLRNNPTNESLQRGDDVTFNEFLTYVTHLNQSDNHKLFNEHWKPISDLCFPCFIDYDIIGHYETISEDAEYVLWKLHVYSYLRFPRREDTYNRMPSSTLLTDYYSKVQTELKHNLTQLYKDDISLFGYSDQLPVKSINNDYKLKLEETN